MAALLDDSVDHDGNPGAEGVGFLHVVRSQYGSSLTACERLRYCIPENPLRLRVHTCRARYRLRQLGTQAKLA